MTEKTISIIIPSYNSEKTIERALQSVYEQNHSNFEIVIIDDGSTDNSGEVSDKYAANDKRIKVVHNKKSQGVSSARNKGLELAKGDYITFLDSDDELAPGFFHTAFSESDWDVWLGNVVRVVNGKATCRSYPKFEFVGIGSEVTEEQICAGYNCICCCYAKIFRKSIIEDVWFNEDMSFGEDGLFSFEAILKQKVKCVFKNTDVYYYNFSATGLASKIDEKRIRDMIRLTTWLVDYGKSRGFSVGGDYWNNIIDGRILEELYFIENQIIRSKTISHKDKNMYKNMLIKDAVISDSIQRATTIFYKYPWLWVIKDYWGAFKKKLRMRR